MNTNHNKPADTLRDGSIKATIWRNEGENGSRYSVNFTRTWHDDDGKYHDSDSFSGTELLRVARLAGRAYGRTAELRAADIKAADTSNSA